MDRPTQVSASVQLLVFFSTLVAPVTAAERKVDSNVTIILNNLLHNYDNRLRPGFGGPPSTIKVDMNIRSMGPISEVEMTYSMDTYFRQTWKDRRLAYDGPYDKLAVHIKLLEKLWKPDTFFYNGQGSYLHTITTPNKLVRIRPDGTVLYSMRLTIKAKCPMYLQYFPVDEQSCPLQFGSYSYTTDQMIYEWKYGAAESIKTSKDMRLSQFDLAGHPASNLTVGNRSGSGEFSTLIVKFLLQRHMGYFLIQVYVPCTLIVVLSWVSFWINREATADRVGLGITTVLTLTTLSMDTRDDLPKVYYATALDTFVIMCFGFVIATLLEYAGVHYFTKIGSGEIFAEPSSGDEQAEEEEEEPERTEGYGWASRSQLMARKFTSANTSCKMWTSEPATGLGRRARGSHCANYSSYASTNNHVGNSGGAVVSSSSSSCLGGDSQVDTKVVRHNTDPWYTKFCKCLQGSNRYRRLMMRRAQASGVNSVSMIDKVSRILFPLSFIILNAIYWITYTRRRSRFSSCDYRRLHVHRDLTALNATYWITYLLQTDGCLISCGDKLPIGVQSTTESPPGVSYTTWTAPGLPAAAQCHVLDRRHKVATV